MTNKILVLSYEEQIAFDRCKQDMLDLGYPEDLATLRAWDCYHAALRGAKQLEMA